MRVSAWTGTAASTKGLKRRTEETMRQHLGRSHMAQMRRQSLVKFDAPLCETIVETPKPQGKEVLVRIERCGLCHSDLHIQDGYADLGGGKRLDTTRGMTLPFTLGHEIAGVVDDVGADVTKELIGKKKAVFPWIGCGQCRDCQNGDENLCIKQRDRKSTRLNSSHMSISYAV